MTQAGETLSMRPLARIAGLMSRQRDLLRGYLAAVSGSAGRLVFSLVYFVALANTLSIADFGLFATASAAGVVLSRILALGFISALYRTAAMRPRMIGTFTAGFLMLAVISLPLIAAASLAFYQAIFSAEMALATYLAVVAAETLLWRPLEVVAIVNNGMGRFGRAALLVIIGTLLRAGAASFFVFWPDRTLAAWSGFYLAANMAALLMGVLFFYPRRRLRFRPALYWRRLPDSLYVAGAEILFYLQMEFDKMVVLALGNPALAGIYAIVMRLADLTAIPIRAFTMMLVQRMMRMPEMLRRLSLRLGIEAGIFLVSTLALACLATVLHFFPNALGQNVSEAAPLVALAICVPGLRNLIEYQAELLFARGQTLIRAANLAVLAAAKAALLALVLRKGLDPAGLIWALNGIFGALYAISAVLTYSVLRRPARLQ